MLIASAACSVGVSFFERRLIKSRETLYKGAGDWDVLVMYMDLARNMGQKVGAILEHEDNVPMECALCLRESTSILGGDLAKDMSYFLSRRLSSRALRRLLREDDLRMRLFKAYLALARMT